MEPHPNTDRHENRGAESKESITARLEGAKTSQAQIRFTLGMMAVISMMMLIASYNAYFSYDYNWIIESNERPLKAKQETIQPLVVVAESHPPSEEVAETLKEQALKDWASSRIVLISLLGIRVSVDDSAVLGTSILLILSVWLLLWARRENHTIGRLLCESHGTSHDGNQVPSLTHSKSQPVYSDRESWLIFHTINSNSIFLTIYPSFSRIDTLSDSPRQTKTKFKKWLNEVGFRFLRNFFSLFRKRLNQVGFRFVISLFSFLKKKLHQVGFGFLRNFFSFFPPIASLIVFLIDRTSYFIPDPFDPAFDLPYFGPFFWWSMWVFLGCWFPLLICCWQSRRYSRATENVLREYGDKLCVNPRQEEQAEPN